MTEAFVTDLEFPDQNYGVLIRSSIQRGRLVDIRPPALPDGYFMFTATDIPGENKLSAMGTTLPIFAAYDIQYFGEPLGIIVGPDLDIVHELVSEVLIETETLAPLTFGEKFASSQILGKRIVTRGDPETILANSSRVFESTSDIGPQDHHYAEPLGTIVRITKEKLDIHTATQWPFHVRTTVSAVLDLDPEEIVVTVRLRSATQWTESCGIRQCLSAQASLAAVLSKKPVKLCFSRQEDFLFSGKSAPVQIRYRTSRRGRQQHRGDDRQNSDQRRLIGTLDRRNHRSNGDRGNGTLCDKKPARIEVFALKTNLPPMGTLLGWGEAQTFLALETHIAKILSAIGASPVEWKLMNLIDKGHITITGSELTENLRFPELFNIVCTESDFPRKHIAYELLNIKIAPVTMTDPCAESQSRSDIRETVFWERRTKTVRTRSRSRSRLMARYISKQAFTRSAMQQILKTITAEKLGIEEHMISFTGKNTSTNVQLPGPKRFPAKSPYSRLSSKNAARRSRNSVSDNLFRLRSRKPTSRRKMTTGMPLRIEGKTLYLRYARPRASSNSRWIRFSTTRPFGAYGSQAIPEKYITAETRQSTTMRKTIPVALSKLLAEHIVIKDGKARTVRQRSIRNPFTRRHSYDGNHVSRLRRNAARSRLGRAEFDPGRIYGGTRANYRNADMHSSPRSEIHI